MVIIAHRHRHLMFDIQILWERSKAHHLTSYSGHSMIFASIIEKEITFHFLEHLVSRL